MAAEVLFRDASAIGRACLHDTLETLKDRAVAVLGAGKGRLLDWWGCILAASAMLKQPRPSDSAQK